MPNHLRTPPAISEGISYFLFTHKTLFIDRFALNFDILKLFFLVIKNPHEHKSQKLTIYPLEISERDALNWFPAGPD